MGLIQNVLRKFKENKEEKKHMEDVDRWEREIDRKKISHYEREWMRFKEEDRQARIKQIVMKLRQKENREVWSGKRGNPVYAPNIFKGNQNIFTGHPSIMKNDKHLLKGGNIFTRR